MRFHVLDGNRKIGTLRIEIAQSKAGRTVTLTSHLSVDRLMLKATLDRHIVEQWSADQLESLSAQLQTDGTLGKSSKMLRISRGADGTLLATSDGENHPLPADALPLTLWGLPVVKDGVFFDATKGGLLNTSVTPARDQEGVVTYEGKACGAKRIRTSGDEKADLTIWLHSDGTLCALHQKSMLADLWYMREEDSRTP